jgi:hypothetical protein
LFILRNAKPVPEASSINFRKSLIYGTQSDVSFNGVTGYFTDQFSGFYEISEVPEPSTWLAGALTLAALGYSQRKR